MYDTREPFDHAARPEQLRRELASIEEQLDRLRRESRILSENLGQMYLQFRQTQHRYSTGREARLDSIVRVSHVADENLDHRYWLEYRRKRILRMLEEMDE